MRHLIYATTTVGSQRPRAGTSANIRYMQSETECAYLAGLIDGEGYVGVGTNHGIVLCMADVAVIYWCHEHFGGYLSAGWRKEPKARPRRTWGIHAHPELRNLIPLVLPFAVLKREELALCLAYSSLGPAPGSARRSDPRCVGWHAERDRLKAAATATRAERKAQT